MSSLAQSLRASFSPPPAPALIGGVPADRLAGYMQAKSPLRVRMTVSPELAKHWLDTANTKNRNPIGDHWLEIAIDMEQGRWKFNGECLKFSSDGTLLDGQHRLMACTEANVPFDTDVMFGLDPGVLDTIDTNIKPRTAAHVAQMEGVENASGSAALAYLLLLPLPDAVRLGRASRFSPASSPCVTTCSARTMRNGPGSSSPNSLRVSTSAKPTPFMCCASG